MFLWEHTLQEENLTSDWSGKSFVLDFSAKKTTALNCAVTHIELCKIKKSWPKILITTLIKVFNDQSSCRVLQVSRCKLLRNLLQLYRL